MLKYRLDDKDFKGRKEVGNEDWEGYRSCVKARGSVWNRRWYDMYYRMLRFECYSPYVILAFFLGIFTLVKTFFKGIGMLWNGALALY